MKGRSDEAAKAEGLSLRRAPPVVAPSLHIFMVHVSSSPMPSVIRVLQLLNEDADFESREGVWQLAHGLGVDFETDLLKIGHSGAPAVLAAVRQLRLKRNRFDLLHAWGTAAMTAATLAWSGPILYSPPPILNNRMIRWLKAAMAYRSVYVVCASARQQHRCLSRGVPVERCGLIRPGVDFARLRRRRDDALRRRLRLGPDDVVLLAAGESTRAARHLEAIWAAGILHVMDPRSKVLLWGRGPEAESLRRHGRRMGAAEALRVATDELGPKCDFDQLLPAADLMLAPAEGAVSALPVAWAMGAGLPIVATASPVISELLEDHHTALMTQRAIPREIARRVLEFREHPSLQWSLADRARAEAYDYFPQSRFLEEYRQLYRVQGSGSEVRGSSPNSI
jgi:glycosyltransferase involved in cell wall biosynthesis